MQKRLFSAVLALFITVQMLPLVALAEQSDQATPGAAIQTAALEGEPGYEGGAEGAEGGADDATPEPDNPDPNPTPDPDPEPEPEGGVGLGAANALGTGAGLTGGMSAAWNGSAETEPPTDEFGIYQISTPAQLAWFRTHVNSTAACASYAALNSDIDLGDYSWTPISTHSAVADKYRGTFDGQFYTISGLSVSGATANLGLFGDINGATIKNLLVEGSVQGSSNYVGGIVGSTRNATIENCSFSGTVTYTGTGSHYIGGIAGGNQTTPSTFRGCVNLADVSGYTAGGILGYSTQANLIESCYNAGTISGSFRSGGIVGQATAGSIKSCYNIGEITGATATPGGIYSFSNAAVTGCYHLLPPAEAPGGSASKSTKINSADGLLELLDSDAFVGDTAGINGGYPLLHWQGTADSAPSVSLSGSSTIYVGTAESETTLSIVLKNIDPADIDSILWDVQTGAGTADARGIATWQTAENGGTGLVIRAVSGGVLNVTATVDVYGELYTATRGITVIPQVTTAEIKNANTPGAVAIGQTLEVRVYTLGGAEYDYENFPELSYEWRYGSPIGPRIEGATARTFTVPTTSGYSEWDYLYVEIKSGGAVLKEAQDVRAQLRSADYGALYPVAYDPAFTLAEKIKDDTPLSLPATHTAGGASAAITWSSDSPAVIDAATGAVTRPSSGAVSVTLTAKFEYGTAYANRSFGLTVYSDDAAAADADNTYLEAAAQALGSFYGPLSPSYGTDTNIAAMLKTELADRGYGELEVEVKAVTEVYSGAEIAQNGDVTYFYTDPNSSRGLWFGQYKVTFTLARGTDRLDVEDLPVNVHWDASKVHDVMRDEILPGITEAGILGSNSAGTDVISDLVLPRVVDGKRWAQVEWSSSDPAAISVSGENQGTADTLFDPYVGKVARGEADRTVTLTAKFAFMRTVSGEADIVLYKVFTFTVKALTGPEAGVIRAQLLEKLDAGFSAVGLSDCVTGQQLVPAGGVYSVINDIKLPTTRDFGVDGKYFPITITTSDSDAAAAPDVANAARVTVYRSPVGATAKAVTLTVSITDKANGITASRSFNIQVQPLTQPEIDGALALMAAAKADYFGGLSDGRYSDVFSVTGGLHPFREGVWNDARSAVAWVYTAAQATGAGIIADELDGWAEQEAWRAFRSSNTAVLDHETLNFVAQPQDDTFVRINSSLTHDVFGKYWPKFKGEPGYEAFAELYRQQVEVYVMVHGANHSAKSQEELEQLRDKAIAAIGAPISASFALFGTRQAQVQPTAAVSSAQPLIQLTVAGLDAGSTVFELFRKALAQQGYTYTAVGSYVKSVTDSDGYTLAERSDGPNSGWIYTVNGKMPSIYMNGYTLSAGDVVEVRFTSDYTKENGDFTGDTGTTGGSSGSLLRSLLSTLTGTGPVALTADAAMAEVARAGAAAGGTAALQLQFRDISVVTSAVFEAIGSAAGNRAVTAHFDRMSGCAVDVRLYIDPSKMTGDINMHASTTGAAAAAVKSLFEKYFKNSLQVVALGQQGGYGTTIEIAARVDLSGMDSAGLVLYSYDSTTNTYRALAAPAYYVDANGYLHFKTAYAGAIVISDGPLVKK